MNDLLIEREIEKILKIFNENNYNKREMYTFIKYRMEIASLNNNDIELEAYKRIIKQIEEKKLED